MATVYVAAMNVRGAWAEAPPHARKLNVTSAQSVKSAARRDFSPMTQRTYEGFPCFEAFWQAGKVFAGLDDAESRANQIQWWQRQTKAKRRYPPAKDRRVRYADFGDGVRYDYIPSRKQVYVPRYAALIAETESLRVWSHTAQRVGEVIVVYDFDGPRLADGTPTCLPVTVELLREKINDPTFPFGHGYIVAAALAGIAPSDFCY